MGDKEGTISARIEAWRQAGRRSAAETGAGDAALAERLRAGEPAALDDLAETWGPRLYRYLLRFLCDGEAARDLTQETLLRALRALRGGTTPNHLPAWLYRIAGNLARDRHRSAYYRRVALCDRLEVPDGSAGSAEGTVIARSVAARRQEAVGRALRSLPPELRQVIVLRFSEELPVKCIAQIVGIPEGTVKSRLYRAYRALEEALAAWRPGGDEVEGQDG